MLPPIHTQNYLVLFRLQQNFPLLCLLQFQSDLKSTNFYSKNIQNKDRQKLPNFRPFQNYLEATFL